MSDDLNKMYLKMDEMRKKTISSLGSGFKAFKIVILTIF